MGRIAFLSLMFASTAVTWSDCQAAGSFQTRPAFQTAAITVGAASAVPSVSVPKVSASDLVVGCGRGRIRDPQTHACRGPANIR